jgi:hypothetical protein
MKKKAVGPMPARIRAKVRKIVKQASWTTARSPEYALAPHQYLVAMRSGPEWGVLAKAIRAFGEYRTWLRRRDRKRFRYKYLVLDRRCYWEMWPVINRASSSTLDKKKPA